MRDNDALFHCSWEFWQESPSQNEVADQKFENDVSAHLTNAL